MRGACMRAIRLLFACLCLPAVASAVDVQITGAVIHPGSKSLPARSRLSDAALASSLREDAYPLGAAWQRASLHTEQLRQKAGLLFDLDAAYQQALRDDLPMQGDAVASLRHWVETMPVTGREVALLDPRAVEANAFANHLVGEGDTLYYPSRPNTVRIVGAVKHACELAHVPLQDALDYLDACKPSRVAESDWLFIIQPDGRVTRQGIGLWNRGHTMPLAPGAVVYVPLRETGRHAVPSTVNGELAAFLATQPVGTTDIQP